MVTQVSGQISQVLCKKIYIHNMYVCARDCVCYMYVYIFVYKYRYYLKF